MIKRALIAMALFISLLYVMPQEVSAASTYENYVMRYCTTVNPPRNCGSMQSLAQIAHMRMDSFLRELRSLPSTEQTRLRNQFLDRLEELYQDSYDTKVKFLTAYYHVMISGGTTSSYQSDSLLDILLRDIPSSSRGDSSMDYYRRGNVLYRRSTDRSTSRRYDTRRYDDYGSRDDGYRSYDSRTRSSVYKRSSRDGIINVWSLDRDTRVSSHADRISLDDERLAIGVKAYEDGYVASPRNGYRLIAVIDDDRYDEREHSASYNYGSNYWEFNRRIDADGDYITFYLLCEDCEGRYSSSHYDDYRYRSDYDIIDSKRYRLDNFSSHRTRYDDRYRYDDDDDLGIRLLRYDYDFVRDDLIIEVTTTIENYGDDENVIEDLHYEIEVDNDRLSSYEYDIDHLETDCDDSHVDRYDERDIDIDEGDQCEIVVEITLDADDAEDERVEIEVEVEADDDDNTSNNRRTVSFTAR